MAFPSLWCKETLATQSHGEAICKDVPTKQLTLISCISCLRAAHCLAVTCVKLWFQEYNQKVASVGWSDDSWNHTFSWVLRIFDAIRTMSATHSLSTEIDPTPSWAKPCEMGTQSHHPTCHTALFQTSLWEYMYYESISIPASWLNIQLQVSWHDEVTVSSTNKFVDVYTLWINSHSEKLGQYSATDIMTWGVTISSSFELMTDISQACTVCISEVILSSLLPHCLLIFGN